MNLRVLTPRNGLLALTLLAVAVPAAMNAQTAVQPRLAIRPLTTGDVSTYKLPSTTQLSGGFNTVGLGEPLYLEVQIDAGIAAKDIAGVVWTLSSKPAGSGATFAESPLTASVPVFEPSDRPVYQVAGRKMLKPDVVGPYIVTATVTAGSSGSTTVAQTYIAATYVGKAACGACHSGGLADPKMGPWSKTLHAEIFTDNINGADGSSYAATCIACHTVGYDANSTVADGGFSTVAKQMGWTMPTPAQPGNFDKVPAALQNLANIQCENCHGPGSQHANFGGDVLAITLPSNSGACSQCHDAPTHHVKTAEWSNSMHAVTTRDPAGNASCVGCHTGTGFIWRIAGATTLPTAYAPIDCATCHEPHGQTTPTGAAHQLRTLAPVKLADGTPMDNAGNGALCMNCHQSRQNASVYAATTAGSAHFGPHEGPQADMLQGANGFTYGQTIPSSAHIWAADDTCVTCHMQATVSTDPAFLQAGGHTFKPSFTPAGKAKVELVAACQGCHGKDVTTFNFPLFDYNNDGKIEGVQTEVQHLLDQLSTMLPPDNKVKSALTIDTTWTRAQLEAGYNWQFVNNDGSKGVHNTAYAVGLLKASIANLTGK
ncbi:MAG TPA: hypothetical protein VKU19_08880 [Bryobacteraceae bacterium]|nr:hypothetical protein [Bryobacteraceae bacterium]